MAFTIINKKEECLQFVDVINKEVVFTSPNNNYLETLDIIIIQSLFKEINLPELEIVWISWDLKLCDNLNNTPFEIIYTFGNFPTLEDITNLKNILFKGDPYFNEIVLGLNSFYKEVYLKDGRVFCLEFKFVKINLIS